MEGEAFKSLSKVIRNPKNKWVFLENFSASLSNELLGFLRSALSEALEWYLSEEISVSELRGGISGESDWIIVDLLEVSDKKRIYQTAKLWIKHAGRKIIFVTSEKIEKEVFPKIWGEGEVIAFDPHLLKKDDSELLKHSRKLTLKYGIEDLVLGPLTSMKFQEAIDFIRTREFCLNEWGFQKKHSRGHGVTLLFHGASGTGKTMAAEVVANMLQLPLYQIDLSSVFSKWVGETEKNLKTIFRAAEGVRGILLFDEGDAIFSQRTEVSGSQDRYSNLEVNYLLQEIETFNGIAILSTNHEKNLDPAFLRRFTYRVVFGKPDSSQRMEIWKRNLPPELPLASDVDFEHLSLFSLTGGIIKKSIREAASRAAALGQPAVSQVDFLWAIKRELQKHRLPVERAEIGEKFWREVAPEWEFKKFIPRA